MLLLYILYSSMFFSHPYNLLYENRKLEFLSVNYQLAFYVPIMFRSLLIFKEDKECKVSTNNLIILRFS